MKLQFICLETDFEGLQEHYEGRAELVTRFFPVANCDPSLMIGLADFTDAMQEGVTPDSRILALQYFNQQHDEDGNKISNKLIEPNTAALFPLMTQRVSIDENDVQTNIPKHMNQFTRSANMTDWENPSG